MFSVRIRLENGKVIAYLEPMGANPGSGIKISEGEAYAVQPGMLNFEVFAICNEVGMKDGEGFMRVK